MAGDDEDYVYDEESGEWLPASQLAAKQAAANAQRSSKGETGRVTIGFTSVMGFDLMPNLIAAAQKALPDIDVVLKEMVTVAQLEALENNTIEIMRRDTLEKENVSFDGIVERVKDMLEDIQKNIFEKARAYRDAHVYECDNYEEFKERVKDGGFFLCHWDGTAETEAKIKEETQATIRCVPFAYEQTPGVDMVSGKPAVARVIIARSY